jgi:hypothetical protein
MEAGVGELGGFGGMGGSGGVGGRQICCMTLVAQCSQELLSSWHLSLWVLNHTGVVEVFVLPGWGGQATKHTLGL